MSLFRVNNLFKQNLLTTEIYNSFQVQTFSMEETVLHSYWISIGVQCNTGAVFNQ